MCLFHLNYTRYIHVFLTCSGCYILLLVFHYQTTFSLCPGEPTATGGDITLKTVKDAIYTWDIRAKWYHLAINLDVDEGAIKVSIFNCITYVLSKLISLHRCKLYLKCTSTVYSANF